ncbi:MAG: hypothetical protein P8016_14745, partial [Sedimentisphaerales bacterium]
MYRPTFSILLIVLTGLILTNTAFALDPDLVAWWKLDDGEGSTAVDETGHGFDGTLQGGTEWVEGISGGGLYLDGTNGTVRVGTPLNLNSNTVTITAWVKLDGTQTGWSAFVFSRSGSSVAGIGIGEVPNELRYHWNNATWSYISGLEAPENEWFFVALVIEPTQATIYLNQESATNVASHDIEEFDGTLYLGQDSQGGRFLQGTLDDVRIYKRSLTAQELVRVMHDLLQPGASSNPYPEDQDTDVHHDLVLSWKPGIYANTHNLFFGTDFNDVNDATMASPLGAAFEEGIDVNNYDIGRLAYSTTYYWRVDEVNSPAKPGQYKGPVWSFTVEPIARKVPVSDITASASGSYGIYDPNDTINEAGLDESNMDLHSNGQPTMWLSNPGAPNSVWIQYDFDKVYKLHQMLVWNYNYPMLLKAGFKDVIVEYSLDGQTWTEV